MSALESQTLSDAPHTAPLPRLYLARHGETAWSRSGRHSGRLDLPLTPHGEDQGKTAAQIRCERPGWEIFRDGCPQGAARWLGLDATLARDLLLDTTAVSVLAYERELTQPAIGLWNHQHQLEPAQPAR